MIENVIRWSHQSDVIVVWACHAIFLVNQRPLKQKAHSLPFVSKDLARAPLLPLLIFE